MVQKKITFLQMNNTILPRIKEFLNVKMVNLEKIKQDKCQPSLLVRRRDPAPYFHSFLGAVNIFENNFTWENDAWTRYKYSGKTIILFFFLCTDLLSAFTLTLITHFHLRNHIGYFFQNKTSLSNAKNKLEPNLFICSV